MFTKKLKLDSYRTTVLSPKQPSFEKIADLVFHSTKLTTDGSRFFACICRQNVVPGHEVSVAIDRESSTVFV